MTHAKLIRSVSLADVQATPDSRGVRITSVGICALTHPACVQRRGDGHHNVPATFRIGTDLAASQRGTHMSRLVEAVGGASRDVCAERVPDLLESLSARLQSDQASVEVTFPLFVERQAPISGVTGFLEYAGSLSGFLKAGATRVSMGVRAPVQTLCPCSREISDYGAHNQRSIVAVDVVLDPPEGWEVAFEDLLDVAEACSSTPLYPVLKRDDERHVTMSAYDRPAFVEDVARDVSLRLADLRGVGDFAVEVISEESIHNHNAYARVEQVARG